MNAPQAINLKEKLELVTKYWNPKIIADLNNHQVRIAKLKGEFVWHEHPNEDEMFYVIEGELTILFEDKKVILNRGELIVIPKGIKHCPVAAEEVCVMLIEPAETHNTGTTASDLSQDKLERI